MNMNQKATMKLAGAQNVATFLPAMKENFHCSQQKHI
jgi:hypothetical protein